MKGYTGKRSLFPPCRSMDNQFLPYNYNIGPTATVRLVLALPLLWMAYVWVSFNGYNPFIEGFFYDALSPQSSSVQQSLWLDTLFLVLVIIGTPAFFILGVLYTFIKQYWRWFSLYILLGLLVVIEYFILPHAVSI
ncbi:hypothetical protein ACODM8_18725 [Vibrio ostreicida]|uniref:Uncharacterized protein n=1 Tax=Vibrio ostreicida TaxID=526588 RepID=A0ABT8BZD8_9VIBR|nr:hypothetical protein [Vibrio ostreicida]MDN3611438.1 hypothetical protein [Vibrio ostreicida]NPD08943.1 hypothetical protein [Vibrio ostreicida]